MKRLLRSAAFIYILVITSVSAQTIEVTGPTGSGQFGRSIVLLTNGNYVVGDPFYDEGGLSDVGAVYLYDGLSHTLISKLTGSSENDNVGLGGITPLTNGNFVVSSQGWDYGGVSNAGAATWVNGFAGLNGTVNVTNSLIGSSLYDYVGSHVTALPNGNYLVVSALWQDKAQNQIGSVTWGNGFTGITGVVSSANSLVSNPAADLGVNGQAPLDVIVLSNSNYLVKAPYWNNGLKTRAGSLTWGDGSVGVRGPINSSISLVGTSTDDEVGTNIALLSNGNYVAGTFNWNSGITSNAGAVTWGNADTGVRGEINSSNSLIGSTDGDQVGFVITPLTNGNYVIGSPSWDFDIIRGAGAVTLCNGASGTVGLVSSTNSLVGSRDLDQVGSTSWFGGIFALPNGNYVVSTPTWDNGFGAQDAGAVTWGSGVHGVTGAIDGTNSLIGTVKNEKLGDRNGGGIAVLSNGNYVVGSAFWNNAAATKAGAITWADGSTGIVGTVNSSNSMVGSRANDQVGSGGISALNNGNYVVSSPLWDNGIIADAGAVTWGDGTAGSTGVVSAENSLVGSATSDQIGVNIGGITTLSNGNYVVKSYLWDNGGIVNAGAVTWGNGTTGLSGAVSSGNSLVGTKANDQIGFAQPRALSSGNYVITSTTWDNGSITDAGAVTWAHGLTGIAGEISEANSLVGSTQGDQIGFGGITELSNGNYLIRSAKWRNGSLLNAGAVTWANGLTGITGHVDATNSLIGTAANDQIGSGGVSPVENGNYVVTSPDWDNGSAANTGALTFGTGTIGTNGAITSCNSVLGASGNVPPQVIYNDVYNQIIVRRVSENRLIIFNPSGMELAASADEAITNIAGDGATPVLVNSECRIIATLASAGDNAVSGRVGAKAWVEEEIQSLEEKPYVSRHYEITPDIEPNTSTGRITLYFTQQEFDDFNADPGSDHNLPAHGSDATGKSKLIITKLAGVSSDGSGSPASYTAGSESTINPDDKDIVWNSSLKRWEVTFEVTGFSGFFVQSSSNPLPVRLISFDAGVLEKNAVLNWLVADAVNVSHFEVQKSADARNFKTFNRTTFIDEQMHYHVVDKNSAQDASEDGNLYYRLKMIDADGSFAYSHIEHVTVPGTGEFIYPNPASEKLWLNVNGLSKIKSLDIIDNRGRNVGKYSRLNEEGIEIGHLPAGIYQVKLNGTDGAIRVHKLVVD